MAVQKTQGFVLRRQDLRETSLSLVMYTRDFGKLRLITKGVRAPEQRFAGAYELFALDAIVFYERKKKNFFLLSQCELIDFFPRIRESLDKISYATYFSELLDSVTQVGDSNPALYRLLSDALKLLSGNASVKRVARIFEIKLLSALGLMPGLRICTGCGRKPEKGKVRFSLASGGILCERCSSQSGSARPVLQGTLNFISHIKDLPFEKIKHVKVTNLVGSEVERLLKSFINYHLDIRLKSREFIEKIGV